MRFFDALDSCSKGSLQELNDFYNHKIANCKQNIKFIYNNHPNLIQISCIALLVLTACIAPLPTLAVLSLSFSACFILADEIHESIETNNLIAYLMTPAVVVFATAFFAALCAPTVACYMIGTVYGFTLGTYLGRDGSFLNN